jgi:hypothetical protein
MYPLALATHFWYKFYASLLAVHCFGAGPCKTIHCNANGPSKYRDSEDGPRHSSPQISL